MPSILSHSASPGTAVPTKLEPEQTGSRGHFNAAAEARGRWSRPGPARVLRFNDGSAVTAQTVILAAGGSLRPV